MKGQPEQNFTPNRHYYKKPSKTFSLWEVFSKPFMQKYTCFNNIDELLNNIELYLKKEPEEVIKSQEWDKYINTHSIFNSWEEMKLIALQEWKTKKDL